MYRFAQRNPEFWALLEKISLIVLGSLLFWLFSLPLVTAPAALAALLAAAGTLVREEGEDWFLLFWRTFRASLGRGLLLGLLNLLLVAILYVDFRFFWTWVHPVGRVIAFLFGALGMLLALVNAYAWPLLAWYPQPLKSLLKRAFLLAGAHPFPVLGGLVGVALAWFLLLLLPGRLLFLPLLVGPGLGAAILSFAAWRAMRRYDPEG